jgi:hypothetical protein
MADYMADPSSWKGGDAKKKLALRDRTGLTPKQIQQYFLNHRRRVLCSSSDGREDEGTAKQVV